VSYFYTNLFVVSLDRRIKLSDNFEGLGQAKSNSRCHNRTLVTLADKETKIQRYKERKKERNRAKTIPRPPIPIGGGVTKAFGRAHSLRPPRIVVFHSRLPIAIAIKYSSFVPSCLCNLSRHPEVRYALKDSFMQNDLATGSSWCQKVNFVFPFGIFRYFLKPCCPLPRLK